MKVSYIRTVGPEYLLGAMRATSGKDMKTLKAPKISTWENQLKTAGGVPHSPMRSIRYRFFLEGVPSWVSVHYVRHHIDVQPYVKSQRIIGNREDLPQGILIDFILDVNVNSLINICKARLCGQAAKETRELAQLIKNSLLTGDKYDQSLAKFLIPPCDWYNKCFELNPCKKKYQ